MSGADATPLATRKDGRSPLINEIVVRALEDAGKRDRQGCDDAAGASESLDNFPGAMPGANTESAAWNA